jgi:hypothetical protein
VQAKTKILIAFNVGAIELSLGCEDLGSYCTFPVTLSFVVGLVNAFVAGRFTRPATRHGQSKCSETEHSDPQS